MKAIALDVDGTITDKTRKACLSAIEAIYKAEKNGFPVIIVTGNIMCSTKTISILFGTSGGLVAENGGIIESRRRKMILGDIEKCRPAYDYLKSKFDVRKVEYSDHRVSEIAIERDFDVKTVKNTLSSFDVEVYDTKFAIHLTDPSVDKGSSLELVVNDMGISLDDILAIGDSQNDIEFLEVVGTKIAVSNADQELKDIADYVTQKPFGDGVKEAIERFVL
jgi:phosphoglycolate phosphatase